MDNRYSVQVDAEAADAHGLQLRMVGHNKRVLELGAASGHVTKALIDRGCTVTAVESEPEAAEDLHFITPQVLVGDLDSADFRECVTDTFDVVLAGDVLEHLHDPFSAVSWAAQRLAPGGKFIASIPNIAHVDVRLSLLQGRFTYQPTGLLDETHLRFFTHESVRSLIEHAGLVIVDLQRVRVDPFTTGIDIDQDEIPAGLLEEVLRDPEAKTLQFVLTAVRDDATHQVATLGAKHIALQSECAVLHERIEHLHEQLSRSEADHGAEVSRLQHEREEATKRLDECDALVRAANARVAESDARLADMLRLHELTQGEAEEARAHASHLQAALDQMHQTNSWRLTAPLRRMKAVFTVKS